MAINRDTFAAVHVPTDRDSSQAAFSAIQTWVPRLKDINTFIQDLGIPNAVLTVGPGRGTPGVSLGSTKMTRDEASSLNVFGLALNNNIVAYGAYYDGNNWVAVNTEAVLIYNSAGNYLVSSNTGLTIGATFTPTVRLTVSDTTITLGSGQISFPATQNPSSGANVLDDYEEGTWTPVLGGDGGTSGQTYTSHAGTYTKIGRLVHVSGSFILSAKGTITNNCIISGLPFTVGSDSAGAFAFWAALNTNWASLGMYFRSGQTYANVYGATGLGVATVALVTGDITNTTQMYFGGSYVV